MDPTPLPQEAGEGASAPDFDNMSKAELIQHLLDAADEEGADEVLGAVFGVLTPERREEVFGQYVPPEVDTN